MPPFVAIATERGYIHIYRAGSENACPSCGRHQWFVGRIVATCAFCDANIPIVTTVQPTPSDAPHAETSQIRKAA
jgi:uncharacterized protein (DUF983 family)